jgi:hypothetical protein
MKFSDFASSFSGPFAERDLHVRVGEVILPHARQSLQIKLGQLLETHWAVFEEDSFLSRPVLVEILRPNDSFPLVIGSAQAVIALAPNATEARALRRGYAEWTGTSVRVYRRWDPTAPEAPLACDYL